MILGSVSIFWVKIFVIAAHMYLVISSRILSNRSRVISLTFLSLSCQIWQVGVQTRSKHSDPAQNWCFRVLLTSPDACGFIWMHPWGWGRDWSQQRTISLWNSLYMVPKGPTSCKGVDCREANMVGGNLIWAEWEPSSVEPMYWWTYRDGGPFMILHKKQGVGSDNTTTWCGTNGVILIV